MPDANVCFASMRQPFLNFNQPKKLTSRLILRILLHQLAAHRQVEDEPPQAGHRIRRLADRFEVGQQAFRIHRSSWVVARAPRPAGR
jgi:hypothetical protein